MILMEAILEKGLEHVVLSNMADQRCATEKSSSQRLQTSCFARRHGWDHDIRILQGWKGN